METLLERKKAKDKSNVVMTNGKSNDLTKNIISFQRGLYIPVEDPASKKKRLTIQAELMKLGYVLSKDAFAKVSVEWYQEILPFIKKSLGVGKYTPFYKNFPEQVMEMSDCELFFNAICHYWSKGLWEPSYKLEKRGIKMEHPTFKVIELGTEKEFKNIFSTIVSINQSITENDKEVIVWFINNYKNIPVPSKIPFKENLCLLASYGIDVNVKSPTDVLRIAVYMSGGDISLPSIPKPISSNNKINNTHRYFIDNRIKASQEEREKFKFVNFKRSQRRILLGLLEKTNLDLGEMKLKRGRWLRLGEKLHPGEYKDRFPKSFKAFDKLRNNPEKIETFYSTIEKAFKKKELNGINALAERPGEFSRKLDWMLRNFDVSAVMSKFKQISHRVSKKVLWELYNHFAKRDANTQRSIMLKGKKSKRKVLPSLPAMSTILINKIQTNILECIGIHFSKMEKLGNVWVDPKLKKIPLPSAMRSVNTSIKTYIRGTRIAFDNPDAKVIRSYVHWTDEGNGYDNECGVEDLDLSVGLFSEKLQLKDHISYTNLKNDKLNCCHSGDIRHRKGPCAEYVDIDIQTCLYNAVRYAIVQVHNFNSKPMHTIKDCVFGLMEREHAEANAIFLPKSISTASKISNESSTVCICILDLKEKEYIWVDLELPHGVLDNFESTKNETQQILEGLINFNELSAYDLFLLHAEHRGKLTPLNKSRVQFKYEDYITSYEKIASYM